MRQCRLPGQERPDLSPPYLFKRDGTPAVRPTVTGAPASVAYGAGFDVSTPDPATISKAAMVRLGAVTHSNNMEQRYLPLPLASGAGTVRLTAPSSASVAPPGYYMLFLVNSAGVPSIAKMVTIM